MFTIGLYLNIVLLFVAITYIVLHYLIHKRKKNLPQDEEVIREHRMYSRFAKDIDYNFPVINRPNYIITSTDMLRTADPLPIYE